MAPNVIVYGYGLDPHRDGVLMATCPDDGFAADICGALRLKHPNQWFGYVNRSGELIKQRNRVESV